MTDLTAGVSEDELEAIQAPMTEERLAVISARVAASPLPPVGSTDWTTMAFAAMHDRIDLLAEVRRLRDQQDEMKPCALCGDIHPPTDDEGPL